MTSAPAGPRRAVVVLAAAGLLTGCGARARPPAFVLPGVADAVPVTLAADPGPPGADIHAHPVTAGANASVALVTIRDREALHTHARYDLTVLLVRGEGTLWLDGVARPMRAGDGAFIPRGTPHRFVNTGRRPAAAVVVFAPPFAGPDQVPP